MGSYQRTCEVCGADFVAKWPRRRRCGTKCSQQRSRRVTPEPPRVEGARWLPLTMGMFALVDEIDFADVNRWNWNAMRCQGGLWYAIRGRTTGEQNITGKLAPVLLHRYLIRSESAKRVDHRDGNGLNNRMSNLRIVTSSQNGMNMRARSGGSSRFKGVWRPTRWRASIKIDRGTIRLGSFATEEEAARAYDEAARRLFGEFAAVNFPRDGERSALQK
jgi:hypothetical protein